MQGTACTTTRSNREVRLASKYTLFLVCTSYWVLEACWVSRVTSDGNVYILAPVDSYTLTYVVSTIAVNLCTWAIAIRNALYNLKLARVVVKLGLHVCETIDTADNLCSVLAKTVKDNAKRILANLIGHLGNLDSTLSSCE